VSFEVLITSPLVRTRQTADVIASAIQQKVKKLSGLHNWNLGLWQGMLVEDVKSKQPKVYRQWQEHPETVCPPEGETLHSIRERVGEALTKMLKKHKEGVIALVLPDPLFSVVRNMLLNEELGDLWHCGCAERPTWEMIHVNPHGETLEGLVAEGQVSG
jgi:phosphoserine phosphatase